MCTSPCFSHCSASLLDAGATSKGNSGSRCLGLQQTGCGIASGEYDALGRFPERSHVGAAVEHTVAVGKQPPMGLSRHGNGLIAERAQLYRPALSKRCRT